MTAPGQDTNPPEGAYVIGDAPYGYDMTEESMKDYYRGRAAGFSDGAGGFRNGIMGGFGSIGPVLGLLLQAFQGTGGLGGIFGSISGFFQTLTGQVNFAETKATQAIAAANAANNKVTALLNGGTRTIYTSNTTWTKKSNLVKLGVIIFSGGGAGRNNTGSQDAINPGGVGGGYAYYEYSGAALDALPSSVAITVASGRNGGSNDTTPVLSYFGSQQSNTGNVGGIQDQRGFIGASASCPGNGGVNGGGGSTFTTYVGQPGGSSQLAAGGRGGANGKTGLAGEDGANAPVTGQTLAGGGGGGGGGTYTPSGESAPGGAGGFPGGGGGAGGRTSAGQPGGAGAPALVAVIEWLE